MARGPTRKVQEAHALRALGRNPLGILTFRPDDRRTGCHRIQGFASTIQDVESHRPA
jgi:hypothetical protein